jgi:hypothetical protein|tara:strand:+ start:572 stop:1711 length:1140 start_codon:yes stop_codon:yes gene_type:complete
MSEKYIQTVKRKKPYPHNMFKVNPPEDIKAVLGVGYEQFDTLPEAEQYSIEIQERYESYVRRAHNKIKIDRHTVAGLFASFKKTTIWNDLKPNSKKSYQDQLDFALSLRLAGSNKSFGQFLAKNVSADHADTLYQQIQVEKSAHKAVTVCKVMRVVWNSGLRASKVRGNPFSNMRMKALPSRSVVWTDAQIQTFVATADKHGMQSMGTLLMMCYYLCQRPGDMLVRRWRDIKGNKMPLTQIKTGADVIPAIDPELLERLTRCRGDAGDDDYILICEGTKRPYLGRNGQRLYNKYKAKICRLAGLPSTNLNIADLRRTGATELADSGASNAELRSMTGHKALDVLSIYVNRTEVQAETAVSRRAAYRQKKRDMGHMDSMP